MVWRYSTILRCGHFNDAMLSTAAKTNYIMLFLELMKASQPTRHCLTEFMCQSV